MDVYKRNAVRLAEVWMDEYKRFYYEKIQFDLVIKKMQSNTFFDWLIGVGVAIY